MQLIHAKAGRTSMISDVELPVRMQLDAYNARDIQAFMQWWRDDCQYFSFPSTLIANGAAEIRARHVERFKEQNLFGKLLTRIVVGNVVVDHETVQRTFPEGAGEIDVIAMYEVESGKIAKAWFKMGEPRVRRR
jgi:hypothetical protein